MTPGCPVFTRMGKILASLLATLAATAQTLPRHGVIGLQIGPGEGGPAIQNVISGGAGEAAGLKPGDMIQALDGIAISQPGQFTAGIARHLAGDSVAVRVIRGGAMLTLTAVLEARPRETSPYAEVAYTSVVVRGTKRSVLITRPRREGRLPAILLMQGLGCYSVDNLDRATGYGRILGEFEKAGFVTMRVEKTGEGDSEGPSCEAPGSTPDLEADGYVAGLQRLKSEGGVDKQRIFVFAHSMGPLIGALAVAREPVAGFVAVETVGKTWYEYDLERYRVQADLGNQTPEEVEDSVREYEPCSHRFYVEKQTPEELDRIPTCRGFTAPFGGVPYTYMQAVADIRLSRQWKQADIPVLVIYGTASPVTTSDENRYLASLINRMHPGRAEYAEVPGMGHDFNRYAGGAEYMREARKATHQFDEALFDVVMPWLTKMAGAR